MSKKATKKPKRRTAAQKVFGRLLAMLILLAICSMLAFAFAKIIDSTNGFKLSAYPDFDYSPPSLLLPEVGGVPAPPEGEITPLPEPEPEPVLPNPGGAVDNSNWNISGSIEKTINGVPPVSPDARMLCMPENTKADLTYFNDTAFLGDSITQGLRSKSQVSGAGIFAYKGISLKAIYDGSLVDRGDGVKEVPLNVLAERAPKNVYVLLGANSYIAYKQDDAFLAYYDEMVKQIIAAVGADANIYLQSITPVAEGTPRFDMDRIRSLNDQIAVIAHNNGVYYLDLHEFLSDDLGNLKSEYSARDGYHLQPVAYDAWIDYILTHTVKSKENPDV